MNKKEIEIMIRVDDIFQRFDRDQDENLSIEEIMPFFLKELDLPLVHIESLFEQIDTNGDNHINKEELFDFLV